MFTPAPAPPTALGYYRKLAPRAAIHVSPIVLGGMSIGDKWSGIGMGSMDKESSFKLLDTYFQAGGNFIDTANQYQSGSSEEFIGEWAEARGVRDQLILATKFTNNCHLGDESIAQKVNYCGNNIKSLRLSVETSLKRLRTSYIDILYIHYWDNTTDAEEMMDGLHNLVVEGKVLYLGVSNVPAWLVVKANAYARQHGKTPFVVYQAPWSVLNREIEREVLPMCVHEGLAITAFFVLASGKIRTDEEEERRRKTGEKGRTIMGPEWERTPEERAVCLVLEKIAKEVGAKNITAVAIAYIMHKAPYVFPVVGGRKIEQLMDNVEALNIQLTDAHIKAIEDAKPFVKGYPWDVTGDYGTVPFLIAAQANIDTQPWPASIKHRGGN
ncbi:Aldo/keto reductase [Lentinus tigrinus ALCF2SS1-7]|uniref:Aldo/keto reductase n=1 Tax=Lentinus tigrinus ALCF2SS1-6 TaxID=1328759 RepID=A0A5C2SUF1_9APHY|nr:Aldo/keto reductase [Lentinus tigrinus ALCF2SS1-6]RPD81421.1 Aldo/keto reductase [Lentinus tigrinus ALCF2SS1-7]